VKINSFEDAQLGAHFYTNNGKRSMLLDLKKPEGSRCCGVSSSVPTYSARTSPRGCRSGSASPSAMSADTSRRSFTRRSVRSAEPDAAPPTAAGGARPSGHRDAGPLGWLRPGTSDRHLAFTDYGPDTSRPSPCWSPCTTACIPARARPSTRRWPRQAPSSRRRSWSPTRAGLGRAERRSLPKGSGPLDRFYQGGDMEWLYLAALGPGALERLGRSRGSATSQA